MMIGPHGLCHFGNSMNEERARRGIRERYRVVRDKNSILTLELCRLPRSADAHTPSRPLQP